MPLFRKKPIVIQADRWFKNGDHPQDGREVFANGEYKGQLLEGKVVRYFRRPDIGGGSACQHCGRKMDDHGWIDTLEGGHTVCPGDWIITGTKKEHYPIKHDIFLSTYEPVDPPTAFVIGSQDKPATAEDIRALEDALQNTSPCSHLQLFNGRIVPEDDTDGDPQLDDPDLDEEEQVCPHCGQDYTGDQCPNCTDD